MSKFESLEQNNCSYFMHEVTDPINSVYLHGFSDNYDSKSLTTTYHYTVFHGVYQIIGHSAIFALQLK